MESHVSSLLRKHGVCDRRELAEIAPAAAERLSSGPVDAPVIGLPAARTTFIGREREQETVLAFMRGSVTPDG